jgi:REP element-mobilizing transposase RayT
VVEAHEPNLSRGMQYLLGRWAQLFNERWCRVGHLWQGRFADRVLESEEARERACNYVMANPVAAKLAATPEAWPYTGGVLATWRSRPRARRAT